MRKFGTLIDDDIHSSHPVSLNIIGGMQSDIFVVVFQRNLFSNIDTWGDFFLFTFLSNTVDVCTSMYQISQHYKSMHDRICAYAATVEGSTPSTILQFFAVRYANSRGKRPGEIVMHKYALLLAHKYMLTLASSLSFIVFQTWLRFGYNRHYYDTSSLSESQFENQMVFVLLSVIIDTMTIFPVNYILNKTTGNSLWER